MSHKDEIKHLKAVNREQLDLIKKQEARHKAELDKRSRLEWRAQQEKLEKLKTAERTIDSKEREIRRVQELLNSKESECSYLHDELRSLRNAELSPSSSMDDLSQVYLSKRERDMAIKNSELSYRVRVLEEEASRIRASKQVLDKKLVESREAVAPLKELNERLQKQTNECNAALRARETKLNQQSKQLREMKSIHQHLQEEHDKLDKKLRQRNNQALKCETEKHRLQSRTTKLTDEVKQLKSQLKDLEEIRIKEHAFFSNVQSPTPTISDDDPLSASSSSAQWKEQLDQLEFDKDEMEAKYSELKEDYVKLQAKYKDKKNENKNIRDKYRNLQLENSQQTLNQESSYQMKKDAARDIMLLEREIQRLRSPKDDNYFDEDRQELTVLYYQSAVNKYQEIVTSLEDFIMEQDQSLISQERQWREDYRKLSQYLFNLPIFVDQPMKPNNSSESVVTSYDSPDGHLDSNYHSCNHNEVKSQLDTVPKSADNASMSPVATLCTSPSGSISMEELPIASASIPVDMSDGSGETLVKYTKHMSTQTSNDDGMSVNLVDVTDGSSETLVKSTKQMSTQTSNDDGMSVNLVDVTDGSSETLVKSTKQMSTQTSNDDGMSVNLVDVTDGSGETLVKSTRHMSTQTSNDDGSSVHLLPQDMEVVSVTSDKLKTSKNLVLPRESSESSTDSMISNMQEHVYQAVKEMEAYKEQIQELKQKLEDKNSQISKLEAKVMELEEFLNLNSPSSSMNTISKENSEADAQVSREIGPVRSHSQNDLPVKIVSQPLEGREDVHDIGHYGVGHYGIQGNQDELTSPSKIKSPKTYRSKEVQVIMDASELRTVALPREKSCSQEVQVGLSELWQGEDSMIGKGFSCKEVQVEILDMFPTDGLNGEVNQPNVQEKEHSGTVATSSKEIQVNVFGLTLIQDDFKVAKTTCDQEVQVSTTSESLHLNILGGKRDFCGGVNQANDNTNDSDQRNSIQNEFEEKMIDFTECIEMLEKKIQELETDNIVLREDQERAERKGNQNEKILGEKNKKIRQLELEMSKLQTSAIHVEKLNQSVIQELKNKASALNSLLEEKGKEITLLKIKIKSQHHSIGVSADLDQDNVRKKEEENQILKAQLLELQEKVKNTAINYEANQALRKEQATTIKQKMSEILLLKRQLAHLDSDLCESRNREEKKDSQLEDKSRAIESLELELQSMSYDKLRDEKYGHQSVPEADVVNAVHVALSMVDRTASSSDPELLSALEDLKYSINEMLYFFTSSKIPKSEHTVLATKAQSMDKANATSSHRRSKKSDLIRFFVVVMDYDPQSLCITGHPECELTLQSGTVIVVYGEMNDEGYYTAQHSNTKGSVPANFIQEIDVKNKKRFLSRVQELNHVMFQSHASMMDPERAFNSTSIHEGYFGASTLDLPQLDSITRGPTMTTSTSSGHDHLKRTNNDQSSSEQEQMVLAICDYNPITSSASTQPEFELQFREGDLMKVFGEKMADDFYVGELNGKRGFIPAALVVAATSLKSVLPDLGSSKRMRALYDYLPEKDSPNPNPEMELSLRAGDLVTVYGMMHEDGYYTGYINDKIGLIPSNFIEEM